MGFGRRIGIAALVCAGLPAAAWADTLVDFKISLLTAPATVSRFDVYAQIYGSVALTSNNFLS